MQKTHPEISHKQLIIPRSFCCTKGEPSCTIYNGATFSHAKDSLGM